MTVHKIKLFSMSWYTLQSPFIKHQISLHCLDRPTLSKIISTCYFSSMLETWGVFPYHCVMCDFSWGDVTVRMADASLHPSWSYKQVTVVCLHKSACMYSGPMILLHHAVFTLWFSESADWLGMSERSHCFPGLRINHDTTLCYPHAVVQNKRQNFT